MRLTRLIEYADYLTQDMTSVEASYDGEPSAVTTSSSAIKRLDRSREHLNVDVELVGVQRVKYQPPASRANRSWPRTFGPFQCLPRRESRLVGLSALTDDDRDDHSRNGDWHGNDTCHACPPCSWTPPLKLLIIDEVSNGSKTLVNVFPQSSSGP